MKKNVGVIDRVLRSLAAIVIAVLLLAGTLSGTLAWVLGIVAIVLLLTSAFASCPLYMVLGISSLRKKDPQVAGH